MPVVLSRLLRPAFAAIMCFLHHLHILLRFHKSLLELYLHFLQWYFRSSYSLQRCDNGRPTR